MSRDWYLSQNPDIRDSNIKPVMHYLKYGRKELRNWREPRWFRKALGVKSWVRSSSELFFSIDNGKTKYLSSEYRNILIYRPGTYNLEIKDMKRKYLTSSKNKFCKFRKNTR